ncbi:MAG TPA: PH domain-containing protein [Rhodobacteraceae bacterium]|nr:PH domain-containing protein [Paracoccaceae bacterium]
MSVKKLTDYHGKPFGEFQRAAWLRDLLTDVTGRPWLIENTGEGFIVVGDGNPEISGTGKTSDESNRKRRSFQPVTLHPALRTSLPFYLPLAMLGVYMALNPTGFLSRLMTFQLFSPLSEFLDVNIALGWIGLIGKALMLLSILAVVLPWLSNRYIVSPEGVEARAGIIARDSVQVRFSDIRSIGLRQGLIDRLLGVGTLEFSSAGTGGVDVRFINIPSPMKIRQWIEKLMSYYG